MTGRRRRGTLRLGLLAAFVGVAAVAIAAFAGLTLVVSRGEVNDLVRSQQQTVLHDTAASLADAYGEAGGWASADFRPAHTLAASAGALLEVRDAGGTIVAAPGQGAGPGAPAGAGRDGQPVPSEFGTRLAASVVVSGKTVGTVTLRFRKDSLPPAERELRHALTRTTAIGTAVAVTVAVLVGLLVADRITRPLRRLIGAVRRLGSGDRGARANLSAPGELGELAAAVDRMAADLEREDDLRRTLVADVAHELRTPVTILAGHFEAILDGVTEPTPEHVSSLHEEVLRLGRVIEDLETLGSAQAAGLRLERMPVDLAEVARETVAVLTPQFDAAEVELTAALDGPAVVVGDRARLGQVVRNLLVNALKFTPGGGRVSVSVGADGATARLTVGDSGPGIQADELPHVFERFWRGRAARGTSGSGIGLAVVDELVRAHDGRVRAGGEEGRGAVFTVELPIAAPSRLHDGSKDAPPAGASMRS